MFPISFSEFDCTNAFFQVCPRMFATAPFERRGESTQDLVNVPTPATFRYINLAGTFDTSYFNPISGTSEFGPYPSNMVARNFFRGPNQWNINLGIYKTTKINERFSIQLRGELFNIVNHANDFVVGGDADVSSFTDAHVQPNGRRNVQFTLKLIF